MDINTEQFIEKLYCTTRDKLFRYAYRLIGRVEKAEELVQEVFVLAMLHKEELLSHGNPQGWLFVTLKYQILNERRRKESISEVPLDDFFALEEKPPSEPLETILPRELADLEKQILIWRFEDQIQLRSSIYTPSCTLVMSLLRVLQVRAHYPQLYMYFRSCHIQDHGGSEEEY